MKGKINPVTLNRLTKAMGKRQKGIRKLSPSQIKTAIELMQLGMEDLTVFERSEVLLYLFTLKNA